MAVDIERFNERPLAAPMATTPAAPPGAPIGDPGMDYVSRLLEPYCSRDPRPFGLVGGR
jgi:hypothetical protein